MGFIDMVDTGELSLRDRVAFWAAHGESLTGTVVGLALIDDDPDKVRVTVRLEPNDSLAEFDLPWDHSFTVQW